MNGAYQVQLAGLSSRQHVLKLYLLRQFENWWYLVSNSHVNLPSRCVWRENLDDFSLLCWCWLGRTKDSFVHKEGLLSLACSALIISSARCWVLEPLGRELSDFVVDCFWVWSSGLIYITWLALKVKEFVTVSLGLSLQRDFLWVKSFPTSPVASSFNFLLRKNPQEKFCLAFPPLNG